MIIYYAKILKQLEKLRIDFPQQTIGQHIAMAMDDHCMENLSDREFYNILANYHIELDIDVPHCQDVEDIIRDGSNLNHILDEDEEE